MRILSFDPYGAMPSQTIQKDSKQHQMTLNQRISDEIAKNEAIRLALLAIADQEKDRKRQQHKFKILNKKQANILLSQLRNLDLDFQHLMHPKAKNKHQEEQKKEKQKRVSFKIAKGKKTFKINTSAAQAIANAAEAWVIARNRGVLDMASLLFWSKDDEV